MAKLSEFRSDTKAISDGTWIRVGPAFNDLEIQSRGFTDEFLDARNHLLADAAARENVLEASLPNSIVRAINAKLLREHLIIGVRNLENDDATPVTVEQFHDMLASSEYNRLALASWEAARRVTSKTAEQVDTARGNSPRPSELRSNGEISGHA